MNIVSLIIFLWLVAIFGILRFMQAAHPYREDSEEQKAEDRAQERALRAFARWRRRKRR
jgi:hypothetical protein